MCPTSGDIATQSLIGKFLFYFKKCHHLVTVSCTVSVARDAIEPSHFLTHSLILVAHSLHPVTPLARSLYSLTPLTCSLYPPTPLTHSARSLE